MLVRNDTKPVRDLFGTPGRSPSSFLPRAVAPPIPSNLRPWYCPAIWCGNQATKTILNVLPQLVVRSKPRDLRAARTLVGVPLRRNGSIVQVPASRRSIAPQFARDRRRGTSEPASNLTHSDAAGMKESNFFSLDER